MSQNIDFFNKKDFTAIFIENPKVKGSASKSKLSFLFKAHLYWIENYLWRFLVFALVFCVLLTILNFTINVTLSKESWKAERPTNFANINNNILQDYDYIADFNKSGTQSWSKRVAVNLNNLERDNNHKSLGSGLSLRQTNDSWVSLSQGNIEIMGNTKAKQTVSFENLNILAQFTPLNPFELLPPNIDLLKTELLSSSKAAGSSKKIDGDWRQLLLLGDLSPQQQNFSSKSYASADFLRQCQNFRQKIFIATPSRGYDYKPSFIMSGQYKTVVEAVAKRYNLSSELIFSIMRTESNYQPFAVSRSNAMGLMQLVPQTAGWEAHLYLTGKKEVPDSDILFDPQKNIEYGVAYLHLLFSRHFPDIIDKASRELCVIAAYNGGPNAVLRSFDADRNTAIQMVNDMSAGEVYEHLTTKLATLESRIYIDKVLSARNNMSLSIFSKTSEN